MTEGKPDLALVLRHYGVDVPEHRVTSLVCCPVHEENRPSMSVNLTKQLVNCHACGFGGDSLKIIQVKEGLDSFAAVVQFAADHFGSRMAAGARGQRKARNGGFRPRTRRRRLSD